MDKEGKSIFITGGIFLGNTKSLSSNSYGLLGQLLVFCWCFVVSTLVDVLSFFVVRLTGREARWIDVLHKWNSTWFEPTDWSISVCTLHVSLMLVVQIRFNNDSHRFVPWRTVDWRPFPTECVIFGPKESDVSSSRPDFSEQVSSLTSAAQQAPVITFQRNKI